MTLRFFVFSFNRGEYLANCIDSLRRCAPGHPITVMDDHSDDPQTRQVLEVLGADCTLWSPPAGAAQSKHGGLYANMQAALEMSQPGELLCFLQDDTQLVRPLTVADHATLSGYFDRYPDAGFVQPAFIRGCNRAADDPNTRYDAESGMYFVDRKGRSVGTYYADILVTRADRLTGVNWQFAGKEPLNEKQARAHFRPMAYLRNPFAAWLPNVPAYRGKVKTLGLKLAEQRTGARFNPLAIMDATEQQALSERSDAVAPYAEDWLTPTQGPVAEPWIYYPLQGQRGLKLLNNLEVKARKWLG
ncbi:glycosyltransferase family A protein [Ferrimonas balearica]|uniref:glycosyltransferase family A protein n=1 Tax=Ferrimonas balearica TaxID=44012 RepID=UPI001C993106|nr:glycosyltransferase family A protein [Ferrimonas balearica]MBY5994079.1 glycosyltransferase family 2 protein [Ferrimonas balearica]